MTELRRRPDLKYILLALLIICDLIKCFQLSKYNYNHKHANKHFTIMAENEDPKTSKKSTKFDRIVDDFIGKRYGAGEAFYGRRSSDLSEEEYSKTVRGQKPLIDESIPMRDNAILIVGGIEDIGMWTAFELAEKGFVIRIASTNMKEAINVFGLPRNNVDIVELKGNQTPEEKYATAVNGVQAIVLCANFIPQFDFGPAGTQAREERETALNILDMAQRARQAKVGQVAKVVMVSRAIPNFLLPPSRNPVISYIEQSVDSSLFNSFRMRHEQIESAVRQSGFDYAIVRAPAQVLETRLPSTFDISVLDSVVDAKGPATDSDEQLLSQIQRGHNAGKITLKVGVLDLAEAVSQAVVQDMASSVTFTVFETLSADPDADKSMQDKLQLQPLAFSNAMLEEFGDAYRAPKIAASQDRVVRQTYFSILDMDDGDLRTSYLLKPAEAYRAQLAEDENMEVYWLTRLRALRKD